MISSPTAGASYTAAAALDRATPQSGASNAASDDGPPDASPDVVVTLSGGRPPSASTYDATGRLPGGPSLNDLGANGPTSLAKASEAIAASDDGDAPDAPDASDAPDTADAPAPEDAVPA